MNGRRSTSAIVANPILVGAVTLLVAVVAVFLAYNANNGLPFVPTYDLRVVVPNAANLVRGNEVRIGGARVGVLSAIEPVRRRDGSTVAELSLKLETAVQPLPVDSAVLIRPRSALALKYIEITRGTSARGFANGDTIPVARATPEPVEIDEFFSMFDEPTRAASRVNLNEFGGALSGRGDAINGALAVFPGLLPGLETAMRTLSDEDTDLGGLFRGLGRAAAETAPVADEQASLFRALDTTFTAFADVSEGVQDSIETGPPALDAAIEGFPVQRPFLAGSAAFFRELRPGVEALRTAAPALADAFAIGQGSLRRSVALNERLQPTFRAVQRFAEDPQTALGVNGLRTTAAVLDPTLRLATPAQVDCNYLSLFLRNAASLLSEGGASGTWQRFVLIDAPFGPNNEGGPSARPASGGGPSIRDRRRNHLHSTPYPNTAGAGQPRECEAGNEDWESETAIGSPAGSQGLATERTPRPVDEETGRPVQPGAVERQAEQAPQDYGVGR